MQVLDLFSGIGGFSLGLEKAGMETVAFCEIEDYPQKVLKKHWPSIPIYKDVTKLSKKVLDDDGITVDVICGGFPCQDLSVAGEQKGIEAERSGLWGEFSRLIGEIRPRYAIVENVTNLLSGDRGGWFAKVLGDLAEIGYDAEWHCIRASDIGARHHRDRVWILAYPRCKLRQQGYTTGLEAYEKKRTSCELYNQSSGERHHNHISDPNKSRLEGGLQNRIFNQERWEVESDGYASKRSIGWKRHRNSHWDSEPNVGRVADGVPSRSHRLKCLGNAVVPQIPEILGKAIMNYERQKNDHQRASG